MSFSTITEALGSGTTVTIKSKLSFVVQPPNEKAAIMRATIIKCVFIKVSFKMKINSPLKGEGK
jgi:hypothetical protein